MSAKWLAKTGKARVIVFGGANGGAKLIIDEITERQLPLEVIAFADNFNAGQIWFNVPVIHPSELKSIEYDQIIISTQKFPFQNEMDAQLTRDLGIESIYINKSFVFGQLQYKARLAALKNVCQIIQESNIEGAVAELGVFQGEFAQYINKYFKSRKLYLFDTFEGFNEQDIGKDLEVGVTDKILNFDFSGTTEELVLKRMEHPENCIIKKGFFPKTAIDVEEKFAFVSLDADLYQPMLEGLIYFYPRLSEGGYIFIHDFFSKVFSGTRKAVLEYQKQKNIRFIPLGDNCSVALCK